MNLFIKNSEEKNSVPELELQIHMETLFWDTGHHSSHFTTMATTDL